MNHEQIDQLNLVDRYVMGKLPDDERDRFEEHFVACPRCTERLRTARNFVRDIRWLAAEQAAQGGAWRPASALTRLGQMFQRRTLFRAVVGLLIVALVGLIWAINDSRRSREEAHQTRILAEQWQHRYEEERQSAVAADQQHQQTAAQQAEQLRELEAKLAEPQAPREPLGVSPGRRLPAQGELPLFVLTAVRGREASRAESGTQILLPTKPTLFALAVALEEEAKSATYRVTILNERKQRLWTSDGLKPGPQDALSVYLRSDLFRPGRYALLVEGDNPAGGRRAVGQYPFLIVKQP